MYLTIGAHADQRTVWCGAQPYGSIVAYCRATQYGSIVPSGAADDIPKCQDRDRYFEPEMSWSGDKTTVWCGAVPYSSIVPYCRATQYSSIVPSGAADDISKCQNRDRYFESEMSWSGSPWAHEPMGP